MEINKLIDIIIDESIQVGRVYTGFKESTDENLPVTKKEHETIEKTVNIIDATCHEIIVLKEDLPKIEMLKRVFNFSLSSLQALIDLKELMKPESSLQDNYMYMVYYETACKFAKHVSDLKTLLISEECEKAEHTCRDTRIKIYSSSYNLHLNR